MEEQTKYGLPIHIKANFFYRRIWNEVYDKKLNATIILVGKPGLGKSVTAQEMALKLDDTFNINRIVFSIEDFLKLLSKGDEKTGHLKPGQAIIFDEIVTDEGAESRGAMSKANKLMTYIAANFRARRLIVFFCLPSLMQLDKNLREVNVTGIFKLLDKDMDKKKNKAKFFWCSYDAYTQFPLRQYPRVITKEGVVHKITTLWIPIAPKEFIKEYELKKMAYLQKNINRWYEMVKNSNNKEKLQIKDIINSVQKEPDLYMDKGKYKADFIKVNLDIGRLNATMVANFLNHQLELNNAGKALTALHVN